MSTTTTLTPCLWGTLLCLLLVQLRLGTALLECRKTPKGTEYVGKITTTSTGRTCQKWGDQHPHAHNFGDEDFGNETLDDVGNYCRNPDGDVLPWCFTTDPKVIFNYCYILMCDPALCDADQYQFNKTVGGVACQAWASQLPHPHQFGDPKDFPDSAVAEAGNFCRNPDNDPKGPWCFTTDPKVPWDYCEKASCPPPPAA